MEANDDLMEVLTAEAETCEISIRPLPTWLVSAVDDNLYNRKNTEDSLNFCRYGDSRRRGEYHFFEGNTLKYLAEYFTDTLT